MSLVLTAAPGRTIEIELGTFTGTCEICTESRDVAAITVGYEDGSPAHRIAVCGRCIAAAIAVRFYAADVGLLVDEDREPQL